MAHRFFVSTARQPLSTAIAIRTRIITIPIAQRHIPRRRRHDRQLRL
jgi:hypothetical protein